MRLLILDGPRDSRSSTYFGYRGTYRAQPTYCDALPEDDETNTLFFWFLAEGGELGLVADLGKAKRYCGLLNHKCVGNGNFELVEVVELGSAPSALLGTFLGYDLSAGYNNSLLSYGFKNSELIDVPDYIGNTYARFVTRYAPQLNQYRLFETSETAASCLDAMKELQQMSPNFFEGGDLNSYRVIGLNLVP